MSTTVAFQPSTLAAPSFQATLNGSQYNATVLWNAFGNRYYLLLADLQGNPIVYQALAGSGPVLQAVLSWADQTATAVTSTSHNVPLGVPVNILVSETGLSYDGAWQGLATGPTTLTYTLTTSPNSAAPVQCNLEFPLNLVAGYLSNCYLFFYDATQSFEYSG